MIIWKDLPIIIKIKDHKEWAEVPVAVFNEITGRIEAVVNTRGWAYAFRRDDRFKKNKKKK